MVFVIYLVFGFKLVISDLCGFKRINKESFLGGLGMGWGWVVIVGKS